MGGNIGGASGMANVAVQGSKVINADVCIYSSLSWTAADIEGTALHEIGHTLPLHHSPHVQSTLSYVKAWDGITTAGPANRLTRDDEIAAAVIYPPPGFSGATGGIEGTITQGGSSVHKAQIGIFDPAGRLVTTSLSNDGFYCVEGLPPATYTIRAFPTFPNSDPAGLYQRADNLPWTATAPTSFAATDADDATAAAVAGGTTTLNLAVPAGSPAMRITHTVRRDGAGWWGPAATRVLRLKRGEAPRIEVIGLNLPNSAAELAEFTITGEGITLSNFGFSGAAANLDATQNDWPYAGARAIACDVSVSPTADLGVRALVLRSNNLPGERYLVMGLVEVYEQGDLSAAEGLANPTAGWTSQGEANKPMLQVSLSAGAAEPIRVRSWTLTHSGTGSVDDIAAVRVFQDADGDGVIDPGEPVVASGTFSGSSVVLPSAHTVPAGATPRFVVAYDLSPGAANASTHAATLDDLSATYVTVRGVNGAGLLSGSTSDGVMVDTVPPAAPAIVSPASGSAINDPPPRYQGPRRPAALWPSQWMGALWDPPPQVLAGPGASLRGPWPMGCTHSPPRPPIRRETPVPPRLRSSSPPTRASQRLASSMTGPVPTSTSKHQRQRSGPTGPDSAIPTAASPATSGR